VEIPRSCFEFSFLWNCWKSKWPL